MALVNSVCTSSTSLTRSESYRLSRFVDAVFLLFFLFWDADLCVRRYKSFQAGIGGRSSFLTCKGFCLPVIPRPPSVRLDFFLMFSDHDA